MSAIKIITILTLLLIETKWKVMGVNITLIQIAAGILFLCKIVREIRKKISLKSFLKDRVLFSGFLFYIVVMTIVILYHFYNTPITVLKYFLFFAVGFVIFIDFYYQEEDEVSYVTYISILLIIASLIIILGLFTTPDPLSGPKRFDSVLWGKSNRMATRFLILTPVAFFLAKYKSSLFYIPFYILVLGIFMTVSRSAIAVLTFFIFLNIKDFIKKENIPKTILGFSVCVFILYKCNFLYSIFYRENDLKEQISGNIITISRVKLWKDALRDFTINPIMGKGIDKFQSSYMYKGEKVAEVNAHCWILHILAEVGIIGFIATLALIVVLFYILFKRCKDYMEYKSNIYIKSKIGIWALIMFLAHNLTEASSDSIMFGCGNVSVLLLVVLGICIGGCKIKNATTNNIVFGK